MAKVGSVGCVGFLVEGTSACVLVDESGSHRALMGSGLGRHQVLEKGKGTY